MKFVIDESCNKMIKQVGDLNSLRNHRVLFPDSMEHRKLLDKIEVLQKKIDSELLNL